LLKIGKTAAGPNETCRLANVLKMSIIEHFSSCGTLHYVGVNNNYRDLLPASRFRTSG
jgi:hypothetical protein